ncbi:protein kinase [Streptomyces regalis]|uniref:Serine/threonine protein kinase n=1 Tax=Streptomyces regalis TaxID=68262 RepID=A0A124G7W1_9ACTN|nr:protein kinase [Streptomyces regalis]KUL24067.1 serine/threonine protein kinase [Streptomyces regalis]
MDDYAGRVLADRYRLPLPPSDEYELTESRAFDTYSGQEVLVRQVPLPEVVEAEVLDAEGLPDGFTARDTRERGARRPSTRSSTRRPSDPAVRRAVEAAQAAARIPDHPRLDQVFDVFAEGGSLWIVSEFVAARPLAALLAEQPLTPYRAAEVASDVLMALRVLHAHGWVHRNITARTVLVCDDGRVMLTGLAVGAAEEALCGYDPVPVEDGDRGAGAVTFGGAAGADPEAARRAAIEARAAGGVPVPGDGAASGAGATGIGGAGAGGADPEAARRAAIEARAAEGLPVPGGDADDGTGASGAAPHGALETGGDIRAARAGAIAAYRAGARAAARVHESQQNGRAALPGARQAPEGGPAGQANGSAQQPYPDGNATTTPSGRIGDPYGVQATAWHGAAPRTGAGGAPADEGRGRTALPPAGPGAQPGFGTPPDASAPAPGVDGFVDGFPAGGIPAPGRGAPPAAGTPAPGAGGFPRQGVPAPGATTSPAQGVPTGTPARGIPAPGGPAPGGPSTAAGPAAPPSVDSPHPPTRWGDLVAGTPAHRGPTTALAAERARQARMAVVGPVTERWAPEQAGPVHENWQLAAPIGPATDLWALGALLFRAVQGHAPYPEESTAELVQMVCAEPPAYAEECGPLRPVVESLLRQDPTERLDFEELRGWLRSLVRSAPEPEAGTHVVAAPPVDPNRLPIVRRRGELVRRRRAGLPAHHGRHKRAKPETASPRRLGRTLLLLVLLGMGAAIAYAMLFMPKANSSNGSTADADRTGAAGAATQAAPEQSAEASSEPRPDQTSPESGNSPSESAGSTETQTTGPDVPDGFTLREDAAGFQIAVANGWNRTPENGRGQVVYSHGGFDLIVVPGRDTADKYGSDPMVYQREHERELQPYRDSSWASSGGLKTIRVGERTMAEGQFTWTDDQGRELFVRNLAILIDGRYHVVQLRGPDAERDEVTRLFEQASATYQVTG